MWPPKSSHLVQCTFPCNIAQNIQRWAHQRHEVVYRGREALAGRGRKCQRRASARVRGYSLHCEGGRNQEIQTRKVRASTLAVISRWPSCASEVTDSAYTRTHVTHDGPPGSRTRTLARRPGATPLDSPPFNKFNILNPLYLIRHVALHFGRFY